MKIYTALKPYSCTTRGGSRRRFGHRRSDFGFRRVRTPQAQPHRAAARRGDPRVRTAVGRGAAILHGSPSCESSSRRDVREMASHRQAHELARASQSQSTRRACRAVRTVQLAECSRVRSGESRGTGTRALSGWARTPHCATATERIARERARGMSKLIFPTPVRTTDSRTCAHASYRLDPSGEIFAAGHRQRVGPRTSVPPSDREVL